MADVTEVEVPVDLDGRLADVGYEIMMVQKFRNLAPTVSINDPLFAALDRHEGILRGKQARLQAEKMRVLVPDA